jgi:hypothetical protein
MACGQCRGLCASAPDGGAGGEGVGLGSARQGPSTTLGTNGVLRDGLSTGSIPPQDERLPMSRRAVLGAAVGLPVSAPVLSSSFPRKREPETTGGQSTFPAATGSAWIPDQVRDDDKWGELLAAYRAAEAEVRGFERATAGSSFEAAARLEGVYGDLGDAMYSALRRLLRAPAPDVAALAVKIELVVEHEVGTLEGGEDCFLAIRRDARWLAGMA